MIGEVKQVERTARTRRQSAHQVAILSRCRDFYPEAEQAGEIIELTRADRDVPLPNDRDRHCLTEHFDRVPPERQHGCVLVGHVDVGEGDDAVELAYLVYCAIDGRLVVNSAANEKRACVMDVVPISGAVVR